MLATCCSEKELTQSGVTVAPPPDYDVCLFQKWSIKVVVFARSDCALTMSRWCWEMQDDLTRMMMSYRLMMEEKIPISRSACLLWPIIGTPRMIGCGAGNHSFYSSLLTHWHIPMVPLVDSQYPWYLVTIHNRSISHNHLIICVVALSLHCIVALIGTVT